MMTTTGDHSRRNLLWASWTINCANGELAGVGVAAGIAVFVYRFFGEPTSVTEGIIIMAYMAFAGVLEGLAIGYFQWRVLRTVYPKITLSTWFIATVTVTALGWILGMLPSTLMPGTTTTIGESTEHSVGDLAFWAALLGAVLGAAFGASQSIVLRRHAQNAWTWIVANSIGWAIAFVFIFLAASLPTEATSAVVIVLIGGIAGILAGLSIGVVTGWFLIRLRIRRVIDEKQI